MKDKTQAFTDIFKLIFNILFIAHLVACIALLSVYLELQYSSSQKIWMIQYINDEWYIRYFNSLYWSVVTMITLGYGDIVPITIVEKILVTFIGLVGCLVLSYSMNQFGLILNDLYRKKKEFKQKMIYLNQYLTNRNLEKNIQQHVLKYYNYVYNQQEFNNLEGNTLLNQLPISLKEEVLINLYSDLINSKKIFSHNFSKQFLTKLMLKMKEKIISPQEPLYNQGDQPDELYFILSGQSKTSEKDKKDPICLIQKKGELVGELEFFSSFQRQWSAKAINVTCVAYITKQDFLQILQDFPLDREKFKMIQDDYVFNKKNCFFSCYGCQKTDHTLNECIQVFYHAPKQKIIKSIQLNLPQIRLKIKRKSNKSQKALLIQKYSEQICLLYQQSLAIQQSAAKLSAVFDVPIKHYGTQMSQQQENYSMQLGISIEKNNKKGNLQKLELTQQKLAKVPLACNESQNTNQSLQHPESLQVSSSFLPFDVSAPPSATFNQKERKKSLLNRTFDDQANSQSSIYRERKSILVNKKPDSLEDTNNQIKENLQNRQQYTKKFSQFSQIERQLTNEGNKSREEDITYKSQDGQTECVKSNSSNDEQSVFTPEQQDGNQQVQVTLNNPKIKVQSQSISSFAHQSLQRIKTIDVNEDYNSNYPFHQNTSNQVGQSLFIIDNFDRGNDFEIYFPNNNKTQMIVSANIKRNFDALQNIKRRKRKTKLIETQEKIKKIQNKYRQQKINSIKFQ
ncbi:cation channel family protein (macronuclear) [Tetrahymena thermophila SB210]|uniref:Cation channel family protein n=1 Tax=Tetrahymena thermophila (strain SB210) TaxID=312017 RepID=I7M8V2_TETTS|nr:cation channel family protein [Tetrahymena thermophila SB210]EAR99727.2 cation channel family protein [Tetrahymena thermophila SB210]|eukprot:XP_001019972.2 cation channel family protein [Tetrahymena thermophila SB210]